MPITETSYFIGNSRWNPSRENYRPKGVNVPVGLLPGQANRVLEQAVHAAQSRTARQSSCLEFGLTGGCALISGILVAAQGRRCTPPKGLRLMMIRFMQLVNTPLARPAWLRTDPLR